MVRSGYVFKARTPSIAVNGALAALGSSPLNVRDDLSPDLPGTCFQHPKDRRFLGIAIHPKL